jgi:hypothetical protein
MKLRLLIGLVGFLVYAGPAGAQEPTAGTGSQTSRDSPFEKIGTLFTQPLHPVIDGVASGGTLGAGIGYDFPLSERWDVSAVALVTPRRYWLAEFDGRFRSDTLEAAVYGRARYMNRLNFFGSGPESALSARTAFALRDPVVGFMASREVLPALSVGGRAEEMWPAVSSGRHPRFPSVELLFSEADAPGVASRTRFGRYEVFVEAAAPASDGRGLNQGGAYRISYDIFDDQQLDRFDFRRVQIEGRHRFAGLRPFDTFTLRGWISSAEPRAGRRVPFYLQHTLGGTSNIRSLHDAPIGGDGTAASLRGFANHRFRDNHLILVQGEYRFGVWGPVEATVFFDAGKAVSTRSELSLTGLQTDYGFSLSLMRAASTAVRADFGFGGDEGARFYFSLGSVVP